MVAALDDQDGMSPRRILGVVFDVGETLVDETRAWTLEARRAGVTPLTLFAVLGAVIERGDDHRSLWTLLNCEPPKAPVRFDEGDFYPDALPCLRAAIAAGLKVGVAGNQPEATERMLHRLDIPIDLIASSSRWGVEKPSLDFFQRVSTELGLETPRIAYVGDRLDNDVLPAKASGMVAVFVRRGPWGHVHALRPDVTAADLRLDGLTTLIPALLAMRSEGPPNN